MGNEQNVLGVQIIKDNIFITQENLNFYFQLKNGRLTFYLFLVVEFSIFEGRGNLINKVLRNECQVGFFIKLRVSYYYTHSGVGD